MGVRGYGAHWDPAIPIAGGLAWVALLALSTAGVAPLGIIEQLFLLAPLVIVPLGLRLLRQQDSSRWSGTLRWAAEVLRPPAAALVVVSFLLPPGTVAASLVAGWLVVGGLVGLAGLGDLLAGGYRRAEAACCVAAQLFLPVGVVWLFLSRLGATNLGFQEPIVLLTGVHFHYTGFVVPLITAATGQFLGSRPGWARNLFRLVALGVIGGPPLIATGFVVSPLLQVTAVFLLAVGLIGLAFLSLLVASEMPAGSCRLFLTVSAISLAAGTVLACAYAVGDFSGKALVDIPQMARFHGVLNAIGFSLCGLLAWTLASREPATGVRSPLRVWGLDRGQR